MPFFTFFRKRRRRGKRARADERTHLREREREGEERVSVFTPLAFRRYTKEPLSSLSLLVFRGEKKKDYSLTETKEDVAFKSRREINDECDCEKTRRRTRNESKETRCAAYHARDSKREMRATRTRSRTRTRTTNGDKTVETETKRVGCRRK